MPLDIVPIEQQSKFPIEKKPATDPDERMVYSDIFALQNAFRILFRILDNNFAAIQEEVNAGGSGGGSSFNYGRKAGYTYPLAGLTFTSTADAAYVANSVRGYLFDANGAVGTKLRLLAPSVADAKYRAALYNFDVTTSLVGSLAQDLGEVTITPGGTGHRSFDFPEVIADVPGYCLAVIFTSGTNLTLSLAQSTALSPAFALPLVGTAVASPNRRYDGTLTYPSAGAPPTLPSMTGVPGSPVLPFFTYQP